MNRRSFMQLLAGGVAATAAVRTWPFRVYSFPSEIKIPQLSGVALFDDIYASGRSGMYRTLLTSSKYEEFRKYMMESHTEETLYGNDVINLMDSLS